MPWTDKVLAFGAGLVPASVKRARFLRPNYPLVGIELREDAVVVARLARKANGFRLAGYGRKSLPAGAFSASVMQPELADPAALAHAVTEALKLAGAEGATRVSLAVPDTAARVFLADLAELPARRAQADEMIRFRIRKSIPFRPEESRLSWDVLGRTPDGRTMVLVAVTPERALRPVEAALHAAGLRCGLVDLATFDVYNALRLEPGLLDRGAVVAGAEPRDIALLNATPGYFSVMILRDGDLLFYRSKNYHVQGGFQGEESLRVVGRELRSTLGYYEEHLDGKGIEALLTRVTGVDAEGLTAVIRETGIETVHSIGVTNVLPELQHVAPELAVELLPAIGLALRRVA